MPQDESMTDQRHEPGLLPGDARPPTPPRGRRRRRRRGRGRTAFAAVFVLVVFGVLGAGAYVGYKAIPRVFHTVPDYTGDGTGSVVVQIKDGDTATDIGKTLKQADVVKSIEAFTKAAAADTDSRKLSPGYYTVHKQMSASSALSLLLDPSSQLHNRVTIPEGFTVDQALPRVAKAADVPLAQLQAIAKQPTTLKLPAACQGHLEGCFFPATYDFQPHTTAAQALQMMVDRMAQELTALKFDPSVPGVKVTPYDGLIVASLAEREARFGPDYGKVARVIYNRLRAGMPLQLDSTVNYALGKSKTNVTTQDTKINSPYNTYQHTGLPPTPIAAPGHTALVAANSPTPGDWLYFVTVDDAGHNKFTSNYNEFLQFKAEGERNRSK
jgi:UPF0755 protein